MSQDSVEKILGRLITDDDFRRAAGTSLLDLCAKYGYVLTYHEFKILENMDFNGFSPLAEYLDRGIKRYGNEQMINGLPQGVVEAAGRKRNPMISSDLIATDNDETTA